MGLIAGLVLGLIIATCLGGGAGAYLITSRLDGTGTATPTKAVSAFLRAVYIEHDPNAAAGYVCTFARKTGQISLQIDQIQALAARYPSPRFTWPEPQLRSRHGDQATVTAAITLTTSDQRSSTQYLRFTVIKKTRWFVCEIAPGT